MFRLAFVGKMRAGKDTAAEYLKKTYLHDALILKFADPLYEIEKMLYNYVGYPIPEEKQQRRLLLQFVGSQWGRQTVDQNIWINHLEKRIMLNKDRDMMITDVRFPNEIEMLARNGFEIVIVKASEKTRIERGATNLTHESETALDHFDFESLKSYSAVSNDLDNFDIYYKRLDELFSVWSFDERYLQGMSR